MISGLGSLLIAVCWLSVLAAGAFLLWGLIRDREISLTRTAGFLTLLWVAIRFTSTDFNIIGWLDRWYWDLVCLVLVLALAFHGMVRRSWATIIIAFLLAIVGPLSSTPFFAWHATPPLTGQAACNQLAETDHVMSLTYDRKSGECFVSGTNTLPVPRAKQLADEKACGGPGKYIHSVDTGAVKCVKRRQSINRFYTQKPGNCVQRHNVHFDAKLDGNLVSKGDQGTPIKTILAVAAHDPSVMAAYWNGWHFNTPLVTRFGKISNFMTLIDKHSGCYTLDAVTKYSELVGAYTSATVKKVNIPNSWGNTGSTPAGQVYAVPGTNNGGSQPGYKITFPNKDVVYSENLCSNLRGPGPPSYPPKPTPRPKPHPHPHPHPTPHPTPGCRPQNGMPSTSCKQPSQGVINNPKVPSQVKGCAASDCNGGDATKHPHGGPPPAPSDPNQCGGQCPKPKPRPSPKPSPGPTNYPTPTPGGGSSPPPEPSPSGSPSGPGGG